MKNEALIKDLASKEKKEIELKKLELDLIEHSSLSVAISKKSLKIIKEPVSIEGTLIEKIMRRKCRIGECWKNSFLTSLAFGYDYVIGATYSEYTGLAIEHAWNADGEKSFDVTRDLFWDLSLGKDHYLESIRLSSMEILDFYKKYNGFSHFEFRISKEYGPYLRGLHQ